LWSEGSLLRRSGNLLTFLTLQSIGIFAAVGYTFEYAMRRAKIPIVPAKAVPLPMEAVRAGKMIENALSSARFGYASIGFGMILFAVGVCTLPEEKTALPRVLLHMGLTIFAFILMKRWTPTATSMYFPPLMSGAVLTAAGMAVAAPTPLALHSGDGEPHTVPFATAAVKQWELYRLQVVPVWLKVVGWTMGSLGLMTYSHRAVLRQLALPLLASTVVAGPLGLIFTAYLGCALRLDPAVTASLMPATTTLGLALAMEPSLARHYGARIDWVIVGPMYCGFLGMVGWTAMVALTRLRTASPMATGFAVGSVAHMSGMAALAAAGMTDAADAAAVGFFLVGVVRCIALTIPSFRQLLPLARLDRTEPPMGPLLGPTYVDAP
jgi:putative effector of murein hydrolase